MNTENIDRIIRFFEDGAPHIEFDMNVGVTVARTPDDSPLPGPYCGSSACLAGICYLLHMQEENPQRLQRDLEAWEWENGDRDNSDWDLVRDTALRFLGLESDPEDYYGHSLFRPPHYNPTPADAVRALRRVKEGRTDYWDTED